jgi:2-polyprenyl-3-methyl-5-hydroxy-6-metoxy-1,4-benzoquinol methylase
MAISESYRALNAEVHEASAGWGKGGTKFIDRCVEFIKPGDRVLDYGCGKGRLARDLISQHGVAAVAYDPAVPRFSREPTGHFNVVVCTDVLEHVEPELLDETLEHIYGLCDRVYFVVGITPAVKILPDGRNAHLTIESGEWWENKLRAWWEVTTIDIRTTTAEYYGYA